jgi:hypothetical protein
VQNHKTKTHTQREANMKKTVRNITVLVLGLLLTGLPAVATTWNSDASVSGSSTYTLGGGSVSAPINATIAWYVYAYAQPGYSTASRVTVYLAGNLVIDQSMSSNGSNSGNQPATQAGTVNCYLEAWQSAPGAGGAGCGVTVDW